MVTIDVSIEDISQLMGLKKKLSPEELDNYIMGTISEVDSEPEGPDENGHTKIAIDVKTSNRPDLWSAEGIARMVRGGIDQPGLPPLDAPISGYEIDVNSSLLKIRPYIGAAVIRGLKLNDFIIKQIIQLQEKIDFSFGRKRKRTSIGIYNIDMLTSPIKFTTIDRNFKFQPLAFDHEMSINEILDKHPKGKEYGHILSEFENVPILMDVNNMVLSLPPIINSNDVGRVTVDTTDVLVEVTGINYGATIQALSVIVQALRDRGGEVSSVKINYPNEYDLKNDVTPHSDPLEITVDPKDINRYLGTKLPLKMIISLLRKRRNDAEKRGSKILVKLPPWRRDVIHWVDVSEDVAMAYGYNNFKIGNAQVMTAGKIASSTEDENLIRQLLTGMGIIEVLNYTLTNLDTITSKVNRDVDAVMENAVEISNPVSSNFNFIRPELLPGLIKFASSNTHNEYPQRIFETGECVETVKDAVITKTMASVLLAGNEETFETILGVLDTMFMLLRFKYSLEASEHDYYLTGRSANILIDGNVIGHLGEIHPQILNNNGIEVPISAMEMDLTKIPGFKIDVLNSNKN